MAANILSMASAYKTWHNKDLRVEPQDAQGMFAVSGHAQIVPVMETLYVNGVAVEGYKMLVERNTGTHVAIHGDGYVPAEPWHLYKYFAPYIEKVGAKYVTAGTLKGYSKLWALAEVAGLEFNIGKTDNPVKTYFLSAIGWDGTLGQVFGPVMTQVVCQNTLRVALSEGGLQKFRQTKNRESRIMDSLSVEAVVAFMEDEARELKYRTSVLVEKPLDTRTKLDFVDFILPAKIDKNGQKVITEGIQRKRDMFDEALCLAPGIVAGQETLWTLQDAFTFCLTHKPNFATRESTDNLSAELFNPQAFEAKRQAAMEWLMAR